MDDEFDFDIQLGGPDPKPAPPRPSSHRAALVKEMTAKQYAEYCLHVIPAYGRSRAIAMALARRMADEYYRVRALEFSCPDCTAEIGMRCTAPGKTVPTKKVPPHAGRIAKAQLVHGVP